MTAKPNDRVNVAGKSFHDACNAAGIDAAQADTLWSELLKRQVKPDWSAVFFMLGGLGAVAGFVLLLGISNLLTHQTAALASLLCAGIFTVAGNRCAKVDGMRVPAGVMYLLTSISVAAACGFLFEFRGDFASIQGQALISFGAIAAVSLWQSWRSQIAFAVAPALLSGIGVALVLSDMLFPESRFSNTHYAMVLLGYGLLVNGISYRLDGKTEDDFSFWGYLIGVPTFWVGMSILHKTDAMWALIGVMGVISLCTSVWFSRRIFALAGSLAVLSSIGYFSTIIFHELWQFGAALLVGSLAIIAIGMYYRKNAEAIENWVRGLIPQNLQR